MGPGGLVHASELFLIAAYVDCLTRFAWGTPSNFKTMIPLVASAVPFAPAPLTIDHPVGALFRETSVARTPEARF